MALPFRNRNDIVFLPAHQAMDFWTHRPSHSHQVLSRHGLCPCHRRTARKARLLKNVEIIQAELRYPVAGPPGTFFKLDSLAVMVRN